MIFVIMGMEVHPFDRLAKAIDELAQSKTVGEDFFVQLGSCRYQPTHVPFERYLTFGEICDNIRKSSVVITHAGAGSTLVCIQQGKHPIMVPRLLSFGEHVDNHQMPFAEKLEQGGLATAVHDMSELPAAIAAARGKTDGSESLNAATELTSWLESFWQELAHKASG